MVADLGRRAPRNGVHDPGGPPQTACPSQPVTPIEAPCSPGFHDGFKSCHSEAACRKTPLAPRSSGHSITFPSRPQHAALPRRCPKMEIAVVHDALASLPATRRLQRAIPDPVSYANPPRREIDGSGPCSPASCCSKPESNPEPRAALSSS